MKTKDETAESIRTYINWFKTQTGRKLIRLHTDRGLEFVNSEVKQMLDNEGTEHFTSNPRGPQQIGVSGRSNRSIVESPRTVLIASNSSKKLWREAVAYCVQILNATTINKTVNKSAYEIIYNKKPFFGHGTIPAFGSECFVLDQDPNRKKFDPRSNEAFVVDLNDGIHGYRVLIPGTSIIKVSKKVVFPRESPTLHAFGDKPSDGEEAQNGSNNDATSQKNNTEEDSLSNREESALEDSTEGPAIQQADSSPTPTEEPSTLNQQSEQLLQIRRRQRLTRQQQQQLISLQVRSSSRMTQHQQLSLSRRNVQGQKNSSAVVERRRGCLVLKRFLQKEGIDFQEIYSPVAKFDTIRTILNIAAKEKLIAYQFDVKAAFLYGELSDEIIFMDQPPGFEDGTGRSCKLRKSIYGMKQSNRIFYFKIKSVFLELRLIQSI